MMLLGSLKPLVVAEPLVVMFAVDKLMSCSSGVLGVLAFPSPVKLPPKMIWPLDAFAMEETGPLKPAKGKAWKEPFTHETAFVELSMPMKLPPMYTTCSSQRTELTDPCRPVNGVTSVVLGLKRATPVDSLSPRLVKFPAIMTPCATPSTTKSHMDWMEASA